MRSYIPDGGSSFGNPLIGCRPILYNITFLRGDPYIYVCVCVFARLQAIRVCRKNVTRSSR